MNQEKQSGHGHATRRRLPAVAAVLLALALLAGLGGCGGNGGTAPPPPPPPPILTTTSLSDGVVGVAYSATLGAISAAPPLSWSVATGGSLPAGLTLDSATGKITGTPTTTGASSFTIQVTDARDQTTTRDFTIAIGNPADPRVVRVSLANDGSQANSDSGSPALSDTGRYLAFTSFADNLVTGDTKGFPDVFLRDLDPGCLRTVRVSVASDGTQANNQSFSPALSAVNAGRLFVAYVSDATNLVAGDTNSTRDVLVTVVDVSGCPPAPIGTFRVSLASDGITQSDKLSLLPSISADGLLVAYTSDATNLAEADSNAITDIYLTELSFSGGVLSVVDTRRVSLARIPLAVLGNTTADIFSATTIGKSTLTLTVDAHIGNQVQIVQGTGADQLRTITDNDATTLTVAPPWDTVPNATSVFRILSRQDFTATVFTATTIGSSSLAMGTDEHVTRVVEILSGQGAGQLRVIDTNNATTFTLKSAWDPVPDATSVFRVLHQASALALRGRVSPDGAFVAFDSTTRFEIEDTNNAADVFLYDRASGETVRVSVNATGELTNGASTIADLKAGDRLVLFQSSATGMLELLPNTPADIFSSTTIGNSTLTLTPDAHIDQQIQITAGTGSGQTRTITDNTATTLTVGTAWSPVPDATSVFRVLPDSNNAADIFLRDQAAGTLTRVSLADDGSQANGGADTDARLSDGGRLVVFTSTASNLVAADRNNVRDVFLRDRQTAATRRLSLALGGTNPNNESIDPVISSDGTTVAFASTATNLVPGDTNNARDIFLVTTAISDPGPPPPAPIILATKLPSARQGVAYSVRLPAKGGTPPLFWSVAQGALPPGLFLDPKTGTLTGTPQQPGQYRFTLLLMDAQRPARWTQRTLTLVVNP